MGMQGIIPPNINYNKNISDEYQSRPYTVGETCIHNNALYKAKQDIDAAEDWTPEHWTETTVEQIRAEMQQELSADKTALADTNKELANARKEIRVLNKVSQGNLWKFEVDYQKAYTRQVPAGAYAASVESIGGQTVVWNQYGKLSNLIRTNKCNAVKSEESEFGRKVIFTVTEAGSGLNWNGVDSGIPYVPEHYIYVSAIVDVPKLTRYGFYSIGDKSEKELSVGRNKFSVVEKFKTLPESQGKFFALFLKMDSAGYEVGDVATIEDWVFVDLTRLFGTGNEPVDASDPRIAWIDSYIKKYSGYNAGELVSARVKQVVSLGLTTNEIMIIPEEIQKLPGYGWSSGDAQNTVERTEDGWQYVQRVDKISADTLTKLETPIITDISDIMGKEALIFETEPFGTITMKNDAELDVPANIQYTVKIDIAPDDTAVDGKTWTSKHIVDMLCPPLKVSGNPVQCYPVEGYPLGLTASWEPTQEGTGDPSPDNIRPIKGRDSVAVMKYGANLFDYEKSKQIPCISGTAVYENNGVTITAKKNDCYTAYLKKDGFPDDCRISVKPGEIITFSWEESTNTPGNVLIFPNAKLVGIVSGSNKSQKSLSYTVTEGVSFISYRFGVANAGDTISYRNIQCTIGAEVPTVYSPYTCDTTTLALPETIYGGTVDAVSGEGKKEWELVTLTGKEDIFLDGACFRFRDYKSSMFKNVICNQWIGEKIWGLNALYMASISLNVGQNVCGFNTTEQLRNFLTNQYDAGTPVQFAYQPNLSASFSATGNASVKALSGVNTVLTDVDEVTVTGRADPIKKISDVVENLELLSKSE